MCWSRRARPAPTRFAAIANDQGYPSPVGPLARIVVEGEPLAMALPAALGPAPLATIGDEEVTNTRRLTLSSEQPEFPPAANYQEFTYLICGRALRPQSGRSAHSARRGRGMDRRQRARRTTTSSTSTPIPSRWSRSTARPLAGRDWRDTVVVPRERQRHLPLALPRFHRPLRAPLPHDEPRGARHDAGGRGV